MITLDRNTGIYHTTTVEEFDDEFGEPVWGDYTDCGLFMGEGWSVFFMVDEKEITKENFCINCANLKGFPQFLDIVMEL